MRFVRERFNEVSLLGIKLSSATLTGHGEEQRDEAISSLTLAENQDCFVTSFLAMTRGFTLFFYERPFDYIIPGHTNMRRNMKAARIE